MTFKAGTADDTALAGKDYTAIAPPELFTIPAGSTSGAVKVKILVKGDNKTEGAETFFVNISDATNATILDPQAVGTINNDD